jgi:MFS family permease
LTFVKKFKSAYEKGSKFEGETSTGNVFSVALLFALLAFAFGIVITLTSASMLFIGIAAIMIGAIGALFIIANAYMAEDQQKARKVPALKVFGWIGIFFWIFMLVAMLFYIFTVDPVIYGYPGAPYIETLAILVTFAVGLAIYLGFRWRNKRRGIDVGTIYSEIPPE